MKEFWLLFCLCSTTWLLATSVSAQRIDIALLRQAQSGDLDSQLRVARCYLSGQRGFSKDRILAALWYKRAVGQGSFEAQYHLGQLYLIEEQIRDTEQGLSLLQESATQGYDKAARYLGEVFRRGERVPQDLKAARHWHEVAARRGDEQAQWRLGKLYLKGEGGQEDYAAALRWFRASAEQGSAPAAYYLGVMHKRGQGVPQSNREAVAWFKRASEHPLGFPARYMLGYMHYKGLGTTQDYAQAAQLFQQSNRLGNQGARFMLGLCYARGHGVPRDPARARELFERSAADRPGRPGSKQARRALERQKQAEALTVSGRTTQVDKKKEPSKSLIPDTYLEVTPSAGVDVVGAWQGHLVQYDWSGQEVEYTTPVAADIRRTGNQVQGWLQLNDSVTVSLKGTVENGKVTFTEPAVFQQNLWYYPQPMRWQLQTARFATQPIGSQSVLRGSLSLFSPHEQEPGHPTLLVLEPRPDTEAWDGQVRVFPNPFAQTLELRYSAATLGLTQVAIYDLQGAEVFTTTLPQAAGSQWHTLSPNVPPGVYLMRVLSNGTLLSEQKLIKY